MAELTMGKFNPREGLFGKNAQRIQGGAARGTVGFLPRNKFLDDLLSGDFDMPDDKEELQRKQRRT